MNISEFYNVVAPRLFEVSTYQTMMCGKVKNLGKDAQNDVSQTDIHGALTYIDQFTQDYLLLPIYQKWPDLVPLVEEDTGLKRNYLDNVSDYSLILDPIDGTAFYLRGDSDYSIMLGLMHKGEMIFAAICYPESQQIVVAIKGKGAWLHNKNGEKTALANLDTVKFDYNSLACHYRLTKAPYTKLFSKLRNTGFSFCTNDGGFGTNATGILRIAKGDSCAFIGPHISLHDFSVPALIIQELGGIVKLFDYNGLDDVNSWSEYLSDYGSPSPKGSNPRYRVIIADSNNTISNILSSLSG